MKQKFEKLGSVLSRKEAKLVVGGEITDGSNVAPCLTDYTLDCSANSACCSNKCERNGTNTGRLCMP